MPLPTKPAPTFLQRYPAARDQFTETYHSVTEAVTPDDVLMALLDAILDSDGTLSVNDQFKSDARQARRYIEALKAGLPPKQAAGKYRSRYPDQRKRAIGWRQPQARQHPEYLFEVDCPYCGRHVTLARHSPREPQHCGADACQQEHQRILARERKRRQRRRRASHGGSHD